MKQVTDPALLAQLNAGAPAGGKPVSDPALLAQLNDGEPPAQPEQSMLGFVGGNLSKGVANIAGLPVDLSSAAIEGSKALANKILGTHMKPAEAPVGGSEWMKKQFGKAGFINPGAEPRTTAQRYGAAALEAAPSAVLPGGSVAGRIAGAVGAGVGGQAAAEMGGGELGRTAGALVGGGIGGLAGIKRGLPKPPTEAARASTASGIPLTLGQESGNKALAFTENRLRELFPSKGTAAADEMKQVTAGVNSINKLADQLSARATANPEALGTQLRKAYDTTVKKIDRARDSNASRDYDVVRKMAGDKPVITYKNTIDELKKMIGENANVPSGDSKKIHDQASSLLGVLDRTRFESSPAVGTRTSQPSQTINAAMKTRSAWGKAARRTGNIFSDIDQNANQVLASRLFGAINRDFEAASTAQTPIAQALKTANANYAKASQSISYLEKSALGKLLGEDVTDAAFSGATASTKAPEAIARKYLTMDPSQAKTVTNILQQHAPSVLADAKSFVLRNSLEKAHNPIEGQPSVSFAKFRREMNKVTPKLAEMGFTPKEIKDIKDVTDTMARAGDRTGINPAGTSAAAHMLSIPALAVTHPLAAAAAVLTPYAMSKALLTSQGRDLLRQVASTGPSAKRQAALGALRAYTPAVAGVQPALPGQLQSPPQ